MSKKYFFILFLVVAFAGHILFFASFTIKKPYTRTVKHPPRIELRYIEPERLELILDRDGRKIYTKILGVADRSFFSMPSRHGFSGEYLQPLQTAYATQMTDDRIDNVTKKVFDDASIRQVSRFDDAYCRTAYRESLMPIQRFLKEDSTVRDARVLKKTEAVRVPVVQIDGPLASRGIISRMIPFYGKARRVLDMTTAGRQESQSDNLRIKCWVDKSGIVKFAMVEKSSGATKIDSMYLGALKSWRFSSRPPSGAFDSGTITFIFE